MSLPFKNKKESEKEQFQSEIAHLGKSQLNKKRSLQDQSNE